MKRILAPITLAGIALAAAACNNGAPSGLQTDQRASTRDLQQLQTAQPSPSFSWSQIRQTLIDIESAQAHTTQTTTFFYNQGVAQPVMSCPSIGYPVATTDQITNPSQVIPDPNANNGSVTLPQIDPNGIYSGDSTGTYVLCVGGNGQTYGVYWEGFTFAISGAATYDSGQVVPTGPSSFNFTTHP